MSTTSRSGPAGTGTTSALTAWLTLMSLLTLLVIASACSHAVSTRSIGTAGSVVAPPSPLRGFAEHSPWRASRSRIVATARPTRAARKPSSPTRGGGFLASARWAALPGTVRLRQCENSGSYTSRPGHHYRGAYQFDRSTWNSVGGQGDPADAPKREQDYRAYLLFLDRGRAPWPVCGRYLDG